MQTVLIPLPPKETKPVRITVTDPEPVISNRLPIYLLSKRS